MSRARLNYTVIQTVIVLAYSVGMLQASAAAQSRLGATSSAPPGDITQIQHVVFLVRENRSFDHYFGTFPGVEGTIQSNGQSMGLLSTGQMIPMAKLYDQAPRDVAHNWSTFIQSMNFGRMDHFDVIKGGTPFNCSTNNDWECFTQATQNDIPNYWKLAQNFVLADHAFSSIHGPSYPSHMYVVAATSAGVISESRAPQGGGTSACNDADPGSVVTVIDGQGNITNPFPCFDVPTMADLFRVHNPPITWRYYSGSGTLFNGYESINHIRNSSEWNPMDPAQFAIDAANGDLPDVTWVISDNANNEHPSWSTCQGDNWAANAISAVMNGPLWNSTVVFLQWDEAGGFYDHLPPPQPDIFGFGPRVPFLIISPWVKKGVYKGMIDNGTSPLAFMEARWGLTPLTARDAAANNMLDAFDFNQSPLPPIPLTPSVCSPVGTTYMIFAQQKVGTPSPVQTAWIRNYNTTQALTVNSISVTSGGSDFTQTNTCPATITARNGETDPKNCQISVTFTPSSPGPKAGVLTVNASDGIHTINLTGNGSFISASPSLITFPQQLVGTASAVMTGSLTNNSTSSLNISSVSITGDYSQTNTCGSVLNAGAKCNINITFTPTATGSRFGQITVVDSDAGSPQVINVTGTGTSLSFSPTSLSFANTAVGAASTAQTVAVNNNSSSAISLSGVSFIDATYYQPLSDFTETDTCGGTIPAFGSCNLNVTFTPQSPGSKIQTMLIFTSEVTTSPIQIPASGSAISNAAPKIRLPLIPTSVAPGSSGITLTVNGAGFASGATVNWNGAPLVTTFVSNTQLTAAVPTTNLATASTALVTVTNPPPNGGTSSAAYFHITASSSALTFRKADINVGVSPRGIAVGDINRDGKVDLAVTASGSNRVFILLSNGAGAFTLKSNPATGMGPAGVALADFNGDGKLDLAIANNLDNTVSILKGNGDGTFAKGVPLNTNVAPLAVVTGDFNGDGRIDMVVTNNGAANAISFVGNGDGTFINNSVFFTGAGPSGVTADDFNNDGLLDITTADQLDSTLFSMPGGGDGTFGNIQILTVGNGANAMASADFNADGKLDLAIANQNDNTVSIMEGNGDGTFTLSSSPPVGTLPISVVIGDFNGDNKLDVAAANSGSDNISLLLGNGDGTFQGHTESPATTGPAALAAGDFNNDGKLDLAVADEGAAKVSILTGQASISPPMVSLDPTSLSFGTVVFGVTTAAKNVTMTNTGGSALNITSIATGGTNKNDFAQTNNCGSSLAAGASCTISITFKPGGKGNRSGNISVTDNANGSPQMITLSGVGTIANLSPTSLDFGSQAVGMTSASKPVILTNASVTQTLNISGITITGTNSGDFAQTIVAGQAWLTEPAAPSM